MLTNINFKKTFKEARNTLPGMSDLFYELTDMMAEETKRDQEIHMEYPAAFALALSEVAYCVFVKKGRKRTVKEEIIQIPQLFKTIDAEFGDLVKKNIERKFRIRN